MKGGHPPLHTFPPVRRAANEFAAISFLAFGDTPTHRKDSRHRSADLQPVQPSAKAMSPRSQQENASGSELRSLPIDSGGNV